MAASLTHLPSCASLYVCQEWWNSVTFGAYWRTWNLPVHQW